MTNNVQIAADEAYPGWPSEATGRWRVPRKEQAAFIKGADWRAKNPSFPSAQELGRQMHDAWMNAPAEWFGLDLWTYIAQQVLGNQESSEDHESHEKLHARVVTAFAQDADNLAAELQALREQVEAGEASDGYHTHRELYEYRMLYHAHAVQAWRLLGYPVVKSWKHSDGELCFGGGWFIVSAQLPTGQVTNHYRTEFWDLFNVPEVELPPQYDGHTPQIVAERLRKSLNLPVTTVWRHYAASHGIQTQGEDIDILTGKRFDNEESTMTTETEPYGTVRWFGPSWDAPVNEPVNEIPVPVGQDCVHCGEKIRDERTPGVQLPYVANGTVELICYHRDCFLATLGIKIEEPS